MADQDPQAAKPNKASDGPSLGDLRKTELDNLVHDAASQLGRAANNNGVDAQLSFLREVCNWSDEDIRDGLSDDGICLMSPSRAHEPDWDSITVVPEGDEEARMRVSCKHCGRSGSVGTIDKLTWNIQW